VLKVLSNALVSREPTPINSNTATSSAKIN
jgi:hypothetical protein